MDRACSAQLDVLHPRDRPAVATNRRRPPRRISPSRARVYFDRFGFCARLYLSFRQGWSGAGRGRMAGVKLGLLIAVLSPVIGTLYRYFSVTYISAGLMSVEAFFQVIAH